MSEYTVQDNDSLIGISLKCNLNLYSLLRMNSLSEDSLIFPGMKLKLSQSIQEEVKKSYILETNVTFCSVEGQIEGKLTLFKTYLRFQPASSDSQSSLKLSSELIKVKSEDFELVLNYLDLFDVQLLDNQGNRSREHIYIIQILLKSTGKEIREDKAIARLYFKVFDKQAISKLPEAHKKNKESLEKSNEIIEKIRELVNDLNESSDITSKIPYPEYIESQKPEDNTEAIPEDWEIIDEEVKKVFNPQISELVSEILTKDQICQVHQLLPDVLKYSSCRILFSCKQNGFSLRTFFLKCEEQGPCVLVIKDSDQYIFGGFISSSIKCTNEFYGDGSTFVFTFQDTGKINTYMSRWSSDKLVSSSYTGIIIGKG